MSGSFTVLGPSIGFTGEYITNDEKDCGPRTRLRVVDTRARGFHSTEIGLCPEVGLSFQ